MSSHFPSGRWTPRTDQAVSKRIPAPAAQGVRMWYRQLAGRYFRFTLVEQGWWGVPPTGTLTVSAQISNGDWYPIHRFAPSVALQPGTPH